MVENWKDWMNLNKIITLLILQADNLPEGRCRRGSRSKNHMRLHTYKETYSPKSETEIVRRSSLSSFRLERVSVILSCVSRTAIKQTSNYEIKRMVGGKRPTLNSIYFRARREKMTVVAAIT